MSRIVNNGPLVIVAAILALTAACNDSADDRRTTPPKPDRTAAPPAPEPSAPTDTTPRPDNPPKQTPATEGTGNVELGKVDYQTLCASCHGPTGGGDGPVAQALDPKPAQHGDGAYMNALTDDYLFQVIKFGGTPVGKSAMMAPFGGSLSDQQIRNVVAFIRTLADPPYPAATGRSK